MLPLNSKMAWAAVSSLITLHAYGWRWVLNRLWALAQTMVLLMVAFNGINSMVLIIVWLGLTWHYLLYVEGEWGGNLGATHLRLYIYPRGMLERFCRTHLWTEKLFCEGNWQHTGLLTNLLHIVSEHGGGSYQRQ